MSKKVAKKTTPKTKAERLKIVNDIKKQVAILGIGEVGIKTLYKLQELNFTSYNTFKVETREEFKEFNDDYSSHIQDIKKAKMIVILGDYSDTITNLYVIKIAKECKTSTNLITLVSDITYLNLFQNKVDTIVYFDKEKIELFRKFDMGECLGIITTCVLAPTLSPGLIKVNLNDLITILSLKDSYYFGYSKGHNKDIHEVIKTCFSNLNYERTFNSIFITFWSNNSLSLIDVYDELIKINEIYPNATVISGYTTDIENNKDFEINVIVG